jgi:hypothetical protein
MAVLDTKIQSKIDELRTQSYEKFQKNEINESFELREQSWNLYPEPKENWNEAYNTAKYAFLAGKKINNLDEEKKWLNRMILVNNNLHQSDIELNFYIGIYKFDVKEYAESHQRFKEVVEIAGLRYFKNQDNIYLNFYKNPEKYF